eukprot:TRINITY_DN23408_c0_g1_i1.p1 TRINITY_DN23408_c0_g1~~TRINITY_DN23408_c0_g1_i1.p1  ORF type:complete len:549 (-),score=69.42 TRINITY_DN23408_c0_g1_i1:35-1681(-)
MCIRDSSAVEAEKLRDYFGENESPIMKAKKEVNSGGQTTVNAMTSKPIQWKNIEHRQSTLEISRKSDVITAAKAMQTSPQLNLGVDMASRKNLKHISLADSPTNKGVGNGKAIAFAPVETHSSQHNQPDPQAKSQERKVFVLRSYKTPGASMTKTTSANMMSSSAIHFNPGQSGGQTTFNAANININQVGNPGVPQLLLTNPITQHKRVLSWYGGETLTVGNTASPMSNNSGNSSTTNSSSVHGKQRKVVPGRATVTSGFGPSTNGAALEIVTNPMGKMDEQQMKGKFKSYSSVSSPTNSTSGLLIMQRNSTAALNGVAGGQKMHIATATGTTMPSKTATNSAERSPMLTRNTIELGNQPHNTNSINTKNSFFNESTEGGEAAEMILTTVSTKLDRMIKSYKEKSMVSEKEAKEQRALAFDLIERNLTHKAIMLKLITWYDAVVQGQIANSKNLDEAVRNLEKNYSKLKNEHVELMSLYNALQQNYAKTMDMTKSNSNKSSYKSNKEDGWSNHDKSTGTPFKKEASNAEQKSKMSCLLYTSPSPRDQA